MKISSNDLIGLAVYTQSGKDLGKIDSFDFDIDASVITHFYVNTGLIKGLWHQKLVIAQSQVISVSKEKMIVEDNTVKEVKPGLVPSPAVK